MEQETQKKVTDRSGSPRRPLKIPKASTIGVSIILLFSLFALGVKFLEPSTVNIVVGDEDTRVDQIPNLFTSNDVAWIAVFSMLVAGAIVFLFSQQPTHNETRVDTKLKHWEEIHKKLKGNEQSIYGIIMESEGVLLQSEIVKKTGLGKGTISIALGRMEARDLLEKKKNGMVNVVLLK